MPVNIDDYPMEREDERKRKREQKPKPIPRPRGKWRRFLDFLAGAVPAVLGGLGFALKGAGGFIYRRKLLFASLGIGACIINQYGQARDNTDGMADGINYFVSDTAADIGWVAGWLAEIPYFFYKLGTSPKSLISSAFNRSASSPEYILLCQPRFFNGQIAPETRKTLDGLEAELRGHIRDRKGDLYVQLKIAADHGQFPVASLTPVYGRYRTIFSVADSQIGQKCGEGGETVQMEERPVSGRIPVQTLY